MISRGLPAIMNSVAATTLLSLDNGSWIHVGPELVGLLGPATYMMQRDCLLDLLEHESDWPWHDQLDKS